MAISIKQYVNITSGVGGATVVANRELIGRIFTVNPLLPTSSFLEFTSAAAVGAYFGTTSEEYLRAVFYFSFISKNISSPQNLSFSRWTKVSQAPTIYGARFPTTLTQFQAITTGTFILTIGADTETVGPLDFSGDVSLAAVAATLETAIQAANVAPVWSSATVAYNASRGSFDFVGGAVVVETISVANDTGGPTPTLGTMLGWFPESVNGSVGAIWSNGKLAETITETLDASSNDSNNFGSFLFTTTSGLVQADYVEAATWNNIQNIIYKFMVPTSAANASAYSTALINLSGTVLTLAGPSDEYHEMMDMIILAATNYNNRNASQNYMYQQFVLTPTVTDTVVAQGYDAIRVNYYGATQQAGQELAFYQRGVLMGLPVSPSDSNVYANEQWLKDAAAVQILSLFVALTKLPANAQGRTLLLTALQAIIDQALFNGVISVGKQLTTTQILFINEITGDEDAWRQIQTIGYWVNVVFTSIIGLGGNTEFVANYTLVYSKDDLVRKVNGTHVLI